MLFASCTAIGAEDAKAKSFHSGPESFSTRPSETTSLQTTVRFGPVGRGIERQRPAFAMKIKNIEEGSPAEATGKACTVSPVYPDLAGGSRDVLIKQGPDANLEIVARTLSEVPAGFGLLYEIAGKRLPGQILPHRQLYLSAEPNRFGPKVKEALKPIIRNETVPEHLGGNRARKGTSKTVNAGGLPHALPGRERDSFHGAVERKT